MVGSKIGGRGWCGVCGPRIEGKQRGRVDPAELTLGRVDSGSELVSDRVDPLPINISLAKFIRSVFLCQPLKGANLNVTELRHTKESPKS